jgi:hypothetical protein
MQLFIFTVSLLVLAQSIVSGGSLSGTVTDEQGYPVTNTIVRAYRAGYDDNGNFMVIHGRTERLASTETDARGEFRFADLQYGEYFVAIEPLLPPSNGAAGKRIPVTTYYPGTLNPATAATIRVGEGEERALGNIQLLSARPSAVRLHIINSTGQEPERRLVSWGMSSVRNPSLVSGQALLPGLTHAMQVESDDIQILDLPPGSYGVSVTLNSGHNAFVARDVIDVGENDVYREIEVRPSPRVAGTVVFEDETASARPLRNIQVVMITDGYSRGVQALTGADGRFSVSGVTERNFRIGFFDLPEDAYVDSARDGNLDALLTPWRLIRDVDLYVVVKPKGAKVSGIVTDKDGATVADATVVLVPEARDAASRYFWATSGASGAFDLRSIAPGSYELFAWRELKGAPYRNSDFLRAYEKDGVRVTLNAGEEARHSVTVPVN